MPLNTLVSRAAAVTGPFSPSAAGISSIRSSRSRVSGDRCRFSIPLTATEMEPVSSETMATTASEFSLTPMPARWRIPSSRLRFTLPDRGSIQPAPTMRPLRTITAPSWIGALFQNRFFSSSADTWQSRVVPVFSISSSMVRRSNTISAPTLSRDMAA